VDQVTKNERGLHKGERETVLLTLHYPEDFMNPSVVNLIHPNDSLFLIIDMQEKLMPVMAQKRTID
jgi:hypothetical protein